VNACISELQDKIAAALLTNYLFGLLPILFWLKNSR